MRLVTLSTYRCYTNNCIYPVCIYRSIYQMPDCIQVTRSVFVTNCAGCYYRLRQLRRIRRSLTDSDSLATLVYAIVNSRIDFCNAVLAGAPRTVTDKLQRVLNAAARVVTGARKFDPRPGSDTARRASLT